VGFKNASAQFADVFAASLNGSGASPVGIGAKVAAVVQQFTQGNITVTNNPLDVAINGGGFYQMDDGSGGTVYARNGQFQLDNTGYIVNNNGLQLKGIMAVDGVVATGSPPEPLRLFDPAQSLSGTPLATGESALGTGVQVNVNLNSGSLVPTMPVFDSGAPGSYNQSTATTVYDSLGNPHTYSLYFVKTSPTIAIAAAEALVPGTIQGLTDAALATEIALGTPGAATASTVVGTAAVQLTVDIAAAAGNAGAIATAVGAYNTAILTAAPLAVAAGATQAQATLFANKASAAAASQGANKWDVYATISNPGGVPGKTDLSAGGTISVGQLVFTPSGLIDTTLSKSTVLNPDTAAAWPFTQNISASQLGYPGAVLDSSFDVNFNGSTQYGAPFAVNALVQDGYSSGTLAGFNIGEDGVVLGRYTNGQTKPVGQVTLASFRNPQGLQPLGDNVWAQSPTSGDPLLGIPGSSGQYGVLQSAALEDSNVDLTQELVSMITQQRAYQANAQTIKTQDSVLQTLVNLR
jgi:flagellar hook protein FlgE